MNSSFGLICKFKSLEIIPRTYRKWRHIFSRKSKNLEEQWESVVFELRTISSFFTQSSLRMKLHTTLMQPRTQGPLCLPPPVRGLSSWDRQDINIYHLAPSHLLLSINCATERWRNPSAQPNIFGTKIILWVKYCQESWATDHPGPAFSDGSSIMEEVSQKKWVLPPPLHYYPAPKLWVSLINKLDIIPIPGPEPWLRDFVWGREAGYKTENSKFLPKWTDFIGNRMRSSILRILWWNCVISPLPSKSYVEVITHSVMVFGDGAFRI